MRGIQSATWGGAGSVERLGPNGASAQEPAPSRIVAHTPRWDGSGGNSRPTSRVLVWEDHGTGPGRPWGREPARWRSWARGPVAAPHLPVEPAGTVVFLHGLNEHGGRVGPAVPGLLARGLRVVAPDMEGHGLAAAKRDSFAAFGSVAAMARDALSVSASLAGQGPVVLAGFSAGGLVALLAAAEAARGASPPAGVALLSPLLRVHGDSEPGPVVRRAASVLVRVAPRLPIASASLGKAYGPLVSARELAAELADPLVHTGRMQVGSGLALAEGLRSAPAALEALSRHGTPTLLLHGDEDRVCDVAGTVDAAAVLGARVRRWPSEGARPSGAASGAIVYEGAHHDLLRERRSIAAAAAKHLAAWCFAVVAAAKSA